MAEGMAVEGMRLVKEYLPRAYADGTDIEARAHMMSAAAIGATAFQKGLGAIHALSHPVGALYDTHHGLTNAVFMPYVLAFNRKADQGEDRAARRPIIGLKPRFDAFLDWTLKLREELGVPHTLAGLKVDDQKFDLMSRMAPKDPTAGGNPVKLTRAGAQKLYRKALEGTALSDGDRRTGSRGLGCWPGPVAIEPLPAACPTATSWSPAPASASSCDSPAKPAPHPIDRRAEIAATRAAARSASGRRSSVAEARRHGAPFRRRAHARGRRRSPSRGSWRRAVALLRRVPRRAWRRSIVGRASTDRRRRCSATYRRLLAIPANRWRARPRASDGHRRASRRRWPACRPPSATTTSMAPT